MMRTEICEPCFDRKKRFPQSESWINGDTEYAVIGKNDKFSNSILYKIRKHFSRKSSNALCLTSKPAEVKQVDSQTKLAGINHSSKDLKKQEIKSRPDHDLTENNTNSVNKRKRQSEKNQEIFVPKINISIQTDDTRERMRSQADNKLANGKPKKPVYAQKSEYQREYRPWTAEEVAFVKPMEQVEPKKKKWVRKKDKTYVDKPSRGKTSEYSSKYKSPSEYKRDEEKQDWYSQILQLRMLANEYEERGRGMHFSRNHFLQLISQNAQMWDEQSSSPPTPTSPPSPGPTPPHAELSANHLVEPSRRNQLNVESSNIVDVHKVVKKIEKAGPNKKPGYKKAIKCSVSVQTVGDAGIGTQTDSNEPMNVDSISIGINTECPQSESNCKKRCIEKPLKTTAIQRSTAKLCDDLNSKKMRLTKFPKKSKKKCDFDKFPTEQSEPCAFRPPERETYADYNDDPLAFTGNMRPKNERYEEENYPETSILERARKRNNFWDEF